MSDVNYSIRLDEDLREEMRDIPDITDRIRQFIRQEVERHGEGEQSAVARFCSRVLDEHGEVGAYCLYQLDYHLLRDQYYLENVETRFRNTDIDVEEARLSAKRVRNKWQDLPRASEEVVEDILDVEGYIDEFYENARSVATAAVEEDGPEVWALWTVVQLFRAMEKRGRGNTSTQSIKQRSITQTLERHGYDEHEVDDALTTLVEAGGLQDWYSSNAYTYDYFAFTDYVVNAIEEALHSHEQKIRAQVGDYAEEEPYLDTLLDLTRGNDRNTYYKEIADKTDEQALETAIQDGAAVIEYRPGRSSTGRRSSLPTRSYAVLSPAVREVVSDAVFRHKIE